MSTIEDRMMAADTRDRPHYSIGVLLDAEDFYAEQSYHRGRLARALGYLFGQGTVAGLEVRPPALADDPDFLRVMPGLALDRLGRLVELRQMYCLRLQRWYRAQSADELAAAFHADRGGVVADVFIRFEVCPNGKTPAFARGPYDAVDAVEPSRLRDAARVSIRLRDDRVSDANPRLPASPWPNLSALPEADRVAALKQAVLGAWREGTQFESGGALDPLPEHAAGQDTTDLFLARLVIPSGPPPGGDQPPPRLDAPVQVDNLARAFALAPPAALRWLGL